MRPAARRLASTGSVGGAAINGSADANEPPANDACASRPTVKGGRHGLGGYFERQGRPLSGHLRVESDRLPGDQRDLRQRLLRSGPCERRGGVMTDMALSGIAPRSLDNARVVVVDDTPANVTLVSRLLRGAGLRQVEGFNDPRRALVRCIEAPP